MKERFDLRHELTTRGIQKFVADYEGTYAKLPESVDGKAE